jgi:phosphoribosylaminoimidazole-succinocarboxamide synthase
MENLLIYKGKVRNIYKLGDKYLLMKASDRVSSFDRHIGIILGKGELLNKMNEFWFNKTSHIINNHLITTQNQITLVHKCIPFKIEMVVRGYITGNTDTSLWSHYSRGERTYCGIEFPDNLRKNQKFETPVITPTTKGKVDIPISKKDIIKAGYMTKEECDFIYRKSMELFIFGQKIADQAGFILVDTKYEFGKTLDGKIVLIDEVHTCDSSRYWIKKSYEDRFNKYLEPEKLDKDCVRDWIKLKCNPYKDDIPSLPQEIITKSYNSYKYFYETISAI